MNDPALSLLLAGLDEAFDRKSWHGTNLRGSLRGVSLEQALRRPDPARHNIWEIFVHAAYWKRVVGRAVAGGAGNLFPFKGSNWFPRTEGDATAWRRDLRLLAASHEKLRAAVAALDPRLLDRPGPRGPYTYAAMIRGIAAHDLYHAGQIQLLKKLIGAPARTRAASAARS